MCLFSRPNNCDVWDQNHTTIISTRFCIYLCIHTVSFYLLNITITSFNVCRVFRKNNIIYLFQTVRTESLSHPIFYFYLKEWVMYKILEYYRILSCGMHLECRIFLNCNKLELQSIIPVSCRFFEKIEIWPKGENYCSSALISSGAYIIFFSIILTFQFTKMLRITIWYTFVYILKWLTYLFVAYL